MQMIHFWKQSHYFHATIHLAMEEDGGDNFWGVWDLKSSVLE